MITSLFIENYALIQHTEISFHPGFVTITGETGAGKSIILGALGLLLGQRADLTVLGDKEKKCVIEAHFDISNSGLEPLFEELDLDYDPLLVIRRELLPSGKSRAFVNETPATLTALDALGQELIDIHSQHQTLTLTESAFQIKILDRIGYIQKPKNQYLKSYQTAYKQYSALKHRLETLTAQELQARKEQDYNQFLYDELVAANLTAPQEDEADEQVQLESEAELLNHTEQLQEAFTAIVQNCDNDDDGIIARLTKAKADLAHIQSYQADLPEIAMRMDSTIIELRDIISSIQQINNNLDYSPQRLQYITDRLDLIYRLEKKHATNSITQLIAIRDNLKSTLEAQQSLTEQISATMEEVDNAFKQLQATADLLTQCRLEAASYIETSILPILTDLGMRESQIQVRLTPSSDYGNMGHDDIQILFNANRGGELKPLHKAASGGELSRLMLAIKVICNQVNTQTAPTQQSDYRKSLIFDEIDTGVSGDISVAVGKMMRQMNYGCQVIAITHLPQIAAKADQHFKVSKAIDATANRTISTMSPLTTDQRINEIAVMLSSNPPTAAAIQIAHELMN